METCITDRLHKSQHKTNSDESNGVLHIMVFALCDFVIISRQKWKIWRLLHSMFDYDCMAKRAYVHFAGRSIFVGNTILN